jgi:hypothetical protein
MLMFELPEEMIDTPDGAKPMVVSKEYTLTLSPKSNLGAHLNSWRGRAFTPEELKGFEVSNVVGAPCQITIMHKTSEAGNIRADIAAITGIPKGLKVPDQWHPSIKYEIEHKHSEVFSTLPAWVQKKILNCEEWKPSTVKPQAPEPADTNPDDDNVPF